MRYPNVGEQVRVKNETGLHTVTRIDRRYSAVALDDYRLVSLQEIVTRHQKTILTYVVQQHFDDGWEDVTEEETRSAAYRSLKDYRTNTDYPTRLIRRREPNDLYQGE